MELYRNDFIILTVENQDLFLSVLKKGFEIREFNRILNEFPRIVLKDFKGIVSALGDVHQDPIKIGFLKPKIEILLSNDKMTAKMKLNISDTEFEAEDRKQLVAEIFSALQAKGVNHGILTPVIINEMQPRIEIVVANGTSPNHGADAQIQYYQLSDKKPRIENKGKVDLYQLQFIDQVHKGDWLGERIQPTDGIPGRTVMGEILQPKKGMNRKLKYDSKTVALFEEDGKSVLRAIQDGAVHFQDGKICILEHYIIDGDVGTKTGNIDFDGCVTIKGTVLDGFSVVAGKDISILGEMGIGAIDKIISKQGDVFIKGGVFGKEKAYIEAGKNIFVKHLNDCTAHAGQDLHIGLYAIGSRLFAKNIILDEQRGKIIGGQIHADVKVSAAFIGNEAERPTVLSIQGFDRNQVQNELREILEEYKKILSETEYYRKYIEIFENFNDRLGEGDAQGYTDYLRKYDESIHRLYELDERRTLLLHLLEAKGEGEITIMRSAFPSTILQIKQIQKKIDKQTSGTFYVKDRQLFFE